jgi:hypothetical protein
MDWPSPLPNRAANLEESNSLRLAPNSHRVRGKAKGTF